MTEQIQSHPKSFQVTKWFGPQTANVMLPDEAVYKPKKKESKDTPKGLENFMED